MNFWVSFLGLYYVLVDVGWGFGLLGYGVVIFLELYIGWNNCVNLVWDIVKFLSFMVFMLLWLLELIDVEGFEDWCSFCCGWCCIFKVSFFIIWICGGRWSGKSCFLKKSLLVGEMFEE